MSRSRDAFLAIPGNDPWADDIDTQDEVDEAFDNLSDLVDEAGGDLESALDAIMKEEGK